MLRTYIKIIYMYKNQGHRRERHKPQTLGCGWTYPTNVDFHNRHFNYETREKTAIMRTSVTWSDYTVL